MPDTICKTKMTSIRHPPPRYRSISPLTQSRIKIKGRRRRPKKAPSQKHDSSTTCLNIPNDIYKPTTNSIRYPPPDIDQIHHLYKELCHGRVGGLWYGPSPPIDREGSGTSNTCFNVGLATCSKALNDFNHVPAGNDQFSHRLSPESHRR